MKNIKKKEKRKKQNWEFLKEEFQFGNHKI